MLATLAAIALLAAGNFSSPAGYYWRPFFTTNPDERYQSAHFILTAPAGHDAGRLLDELEGARRDVLMFGLALPNRVEASSYRTTGEFTRRSGGRAFNLAYAVGERIHLQPLSLLLKRGDLSQVLRHELTHIGLAGAVRRGLPQWMNEGIAMRVGGEMPPGREKFRTLSALEDSLAHSRTHATLRAAYAGSRYLVDRLIADYGAERVLRLVRDMARIGDFSARFRELTGADAAVWCRRILAR
jgi:hypothetical protein